MIHISMQFFGGRGSSGRAAGGGGGAANTAAANQPYSTKLQAVQNMTNDEFEDYLSNGLNGITLDSSYDYAKNCNFQKMVADCGVNDKPTTLDKDVFESMIAADPSLKVLYRGVENGQNITADGILNQIKYSDGFHVGGGFYGDGLYYTGDVNYARMYAGNFGKVQRVAIDPNAKIISRKDLDKQFNALPIKTQFALGRAGKQSTSGGWYNKGESQLALKLGYDIIQGFDSDHLIILNRKALIIDKANYSNTGARDVSRKVPSSNVYTNISQLT